MSRYDYQMLSKKIHIWQPEEGSCFQQLTVHFTGAKQERGLSVGSAGAGFKSKLALKLLSIIKMTPSVSAICILCRKEIKGLQLGATANHHRAALTDQ